MDADHWTGLWQLKCPGKIKHFLCRLTHNSIAYRMELQRRGTELDTNCVLRNRLDRMVGTCFSNARMFPECGGLWTWRLAGHGWLRSNIHEGSEERVVYKPSLRQRCCRQSAGLASWKSTLMALSVLILAAMPFCAGALHILGRGKKKMLSIYVLSSTKWWQVSSLRSSCFVCYVYSSRTQTPPRHEACYRSSRVACAFWHVKPVARLSYEKGTAYKY